MGRLTGERRAIAAALLAFYGYIYLLNAFFAPPEWSAYFFSVTFLYGAGFFGLVAGYFWARWYSIGLGISGLIVGIFGVFQLGFEPVLVFYGATHGLVSLILWGSGMAGAFDGKKEWRERFHLDESSTHRLGKAVIRLGVSLPYIIMYALAPREGAGMALAAGALALVGAYGFARMRTWGVFAIGGAAIAAAASLLTGVGTTMLPLGGSFGASFVLDASVLGIAAMALLAAAAAPFAKPMVKYLASPKN